MIWYSIIVVDIDQGGCVELTRGRCERPCGEDWALMSWICIQPRPTTNQGIQPRPPPSVDIAIIAHITFLYGNVILCASQLHIFWLFTLYLYFIRRLDGKDQLQYSWVQNASRWTMSLYFCWPLYCDGRDQRIFTYLWKNASFLPSCKDGGLERGGRWNIDISIYTYGYMLVELWIVYGRW